MIYVSFSVCINTVIYILIDADVKVTKLSKPVQCSNDIELQSTSSLGFTSMFSSGDSHADNSHADNSKPVQKNILYIRDEEVTNAKAVVNAKDKNEDETDLKKTPQTASALSADENSKPREYIFNESNLKVFSYTCIINLLEKLTKRARIS